MNRDDLHRLSKEQLIELVLRLQRPEKTSRNSSKPPSTDKKARREQSRPGGAKPGHEAHNRPLAESPDEFRDYRPEVCEQCGGRFGPDAVEELIGEYDEIEIPPVKPYIIRHRRYACRCGSCGLPAEVRRRPSRGRRRLVRAFTPWRFTTKASRPRPTSGYGSCSATPSALR